MILKSGDNFDQIKKIGDYHPYHRGTNPSFDTFSSKILEVKDKKTSGYTYFENQILNMLSTDKFAVCTTPSSRVGPANNGITELAKLIATKANKKDATSCLYRHTEVPSAHLGGERNIEIHLKSIKVLNQHLIKGEFVLLMDDVTTSGSSLLACKQLLIEAGAKNVQCLALGKTQIHFL